MNRLRTLAIGAAQTAAKSTSDALILAGGGLVVFGVYQLHEPAAYMVAGLWVTTLGWLVGRE